MKLASAIALKTALHLCPTAFGRWPSATSIWVPTKMPGENPGRLRGWRFILLNVATGLANVVVLSNVPGYTILAASNVAWILVLACGHRLSNDDYSFRAACGDHS